MDGIDPNMIGPIQGPLIQPLDNSTTSGQESAQDTIDKSKDIASLVYLYSAAMPTLPPPDYDMSMDLNAAATGGITADMATKLFEKMSQLNEEIVQDMLDAWLEQIQEQAERVRDWLKSPAYMHFLELKFPDINPENIVNMLSNLQQTRAASVEAASNFSKSGLDPSSAAFMAGSLILGTGMIVDFVPQAAADGNARAVPSISNQPNVMAESMPSFQNVVQEPNLVAQLGFLSGMIGAGAVHYSMLSTVLGAVEKGAKPESSETYRQFAGRVLNLVKDPNFSEHVLFRIIDRMPGAEKMTGEVKNQMVAIVKAVLLSTSLAALYKGETKWLGPEVKNLLEGDLSGFFEGGKEVDRNLRTSIGMELQAAYTVLTGTQRGRLIESLTDYFTSQPTLQELSNIDRTFQNITARLVREELQG